MMDARAMCLNSGALTSGSVLKISGAATPRDKELFFGTW